MTPIDLFYQQMPQAAEVATIADIADMIEQIGVDSIRDIFSTIVRGISEEDEDDSLPTR